MSNQHPINGAPVNGDAETFSGPDAVNYALETAVITATAEQGIYSILRETAVLSSHSPELTDVTDTATLNDNITATRTTQFTVTETAELHASATESSTLTNTINETAVLDDSLTDTTNEEITTDSAVLNDSANDYLTANTTSSDSARLGDRAWSGRVDNVTDSAALNDYLTASNFSLVEAAETATLNDTVSQAYTAISTVADSAILNDSLVPTGALQNTVVTTGYLSDQLLTADGLTATCWTANVVNWAMSRHIDGGISSRTNSFAVAPAGLYAVDSAYAAATLTTGHVKFKTSIKKRVPHLYVVGSYTGDLEVGVTGELRGVAASYSYTVTVSYTHLTLPTIYSV